MLFFLIMKLLRMSFFESKYNQNVKQSFLKSFVKLEFVQVVFVYKLGFRWRKGCECREMCIFECDCQWFVGKEREEMIKVYMNIFNIII